MVRKESSRILKFLTRFCLGCDVSRYPGGSVLCSDEVVMSQGFPEFLYCVSIRL